MYGRIDTQPSHSTYSVNQTVKKKKASLSSERHLLGTGCQKTDFCGNGSQNLLRFCLVLSHLPVSIFERVFQLIKG